MKQKSKAGRRDWRFGGGAGDAIPAKVRRLPRRPARRPWRARLGGPDYDRERGGVGHWMLDLVTGELVWSPEVFRLFGIPPSRFGATYEAFLAAIHPADREAVDRAYNRSLSDRLPYEVTHRLVTGDGRIKWVREKCKTEFDVAGRPLRSLGVVRDVTDQCEALIALDESEARFRSIFEAANTAIVSTDSSGRVTDCNEAFLRLLGHDLETLRQMKLADLTHPEDRGLESEALAEIRAGKRDHYRIEKRYLARDGRPLWCDISVAAIRDGCGGVKSLVAVVSDMTERKAADEAQRASHETLVSILETTLDGFWRIGNEGRLLEVNPAYCRMSGYSREELLAMRISDLEAAESPEETRRHIEHIMEHGSDLFETRHRRKDGSIWHVEVSTTYRPGAGGQFLAFLRDISDRKQAEVDLRIAAATFEAQEGILITDANGVVQRVNPAFTELTGYRADEIVGRTPRILKSGRHDAAFYRAMWDSLARTGVWQGEVWDRRKSGEIYPKWLTISAVRDAQGVVSHYVSVHSDITERKQAEDRVRQMAFFDPLTSLPNRRLLHDRLGQAMAASKRSGGRGALMFVDLDNFKPLNDRYGHDVGDLLLLEAAKRLQDGVREVDTVARFGGDEFVVLLTDLSADPGAAAVEAGQVAEKLLAALSSPYTLRSGREGEKAPIEHVCTASIGLTVFSDHEIDRDDILKEADAAMYRAKKAGGGRVCRHGGKEG